jgi:WD40 repeat protein
LLARALPQLDARAVATMKAAGPIRLAAVSPDGARVLTASSRGKDLTDRTPDVVQLWNAATGALEATLDGNAGNVDRAVFSSNGKRVATSSSWAERRRREPSSPATDTIDDPYKSITHSYVDVWDVATGKRTLALAFENRSIGDIAILPSDRTIAIAFVDALALHALDGGAELASVPAKRAAVSADGQFGFSWDGQQAVVTSLKYMRPEAPFHDTSYPQTVQFLGSNVLLGDDSANVELWYGVTGAHAGTFTTGARVFDRRIAVPRKGERLAMIDRDNTVSVWNSIAVGTPSFSLRGHVAPIRDIEFSADNTRILTASDDGTARVWDGSDGALLATLQHGAQVIAARFVGDGSRVVTAGRDGNARLWTVPIHRAYVDTPDDYQNSPDVRAFSPTAPRIAIVHGNAIRIIDTTTGKPLATLTGHDAAIAAFAWSPDGTRIVSASGQRVGPLSSGDKTARIWDASTGKELARVDGLAGEVARVVWDARGARVIARSRDSFDVWNVEARTHESFNGTFVATDASGESIAAVGDDLHVVAASGGKLALGPRPGRDDAVVFSPDGRRIAIGGMDSVRIVDVATARTIATLDARGWLRTPTFSPDGTLLATTDGRTGGRIWDATTGVLRASFDGHTDHVTSIAFSPDGLLVATTSFDRSVRVWDAANGSALAVFGNHEHWVTGATFSPDGSQLATDVARAPRVRIWDLRRETRSPTVVMDLVRCRIPLRVVDGRALPAQIDATRCRD